MILIGKNERFISADHIQHIFVDPLLEPQRYAVVVQMIGGSAVFGRRDSDAMTLQMAFELRKRIVRAIVNYKSSDKPEIQHVEFPKYEAVHPEEESETE